MAQIQIPEGIHWDPTRMAFDPTRIGYISCQIADCKIYRNGPIWIEIDPDIVTITKYRESDPRWEKIAKLTNQELAALSRSELAILDTVYDEMILVRQPISDRCPHDTIVDFLKSIGDVRSQEQELHLLSFAIRRELAKLKKLGFAVQQLCINSNVYCGFNAYKIRGFEIEWREDPDKGHAAHPIQRYWSVPVEVDDNLPDGGYYIQLRDAGKFYIPRFDNP